MFIRGLRTPKSPVSGGLHPQAPHAVGLNPPSQLVIGYHWLAFLNQVNQIQLFQRSMMDNLDTHIEINEVKKMSNLLSPQNKKHSGLRKSLSQKISSTVKEIRSEIDAPVEVCNMFGPLG